MTEFEKKLARAVVVVVFARFLALPRESEVYIIVIQQSRRVPHVIVIATVCCSPCLFARERARGDIRDSVSDFRRCVAGIFVVYVEEEERARGGGREGELEIARRTRKHRKRRSAGENKKREKR